MGDYGRITLAGPRRLNTGLGAPEVEDCGQALFLYSVDVFGRPNDIGKARPSQS